MLFKRDYSKLTKEEQNQLDKAKKFFRENIGDPNGRVIASTITLREYHDLLPKVHPFYNSLFPNNFLSSKVVSEQKDTLEKIKIDFKKLLDNERVNEREILNYINNNEAYPIIGSIFQAGYDFGHHDTYLFKEFEITGTYRADYLLIGKNSHGFHFIFIEMESPKSNSVLANGDFGISIRKGISQVEDWDSWIESNFGSLKLIFKKYQSNDKTLPSEFTELDKTRIHYVVVAGRRKEFKEKTYNLKRKLLQRSNIRLIHYDNLLDYLDRLKKYNSY